MAGTATIDTESKDEPFVQAKWAVKLTRRTVNLHVVHDMEAPEGPLTAENCARDFANRSKDNPGSAHKCIDTDSVVRCVHDKDQAAAAPGSNSNGLHYELCGYARQTPEEWLDGDSQRTMYQAAREIADDMHRYNNRPIFRTAADLIAGHLDGWTTHAQVSAAYRRSTHTDPGPGFPIDHFGGLILGHYNGTIDRGEDDLNETQSLQLDGLAEQFLSPDRLELLPDVFNAGPLAREVRAQLTQFQGSTNMYLASINTGLAALVKDVDAVLAKELTANAKELTAEAKKLADAKT